MSHHFYLFYLIISFCIGMVFFWPSLIIYMQRGPSFKYYKNFRYLFHFCAAFTILFLSNSIYFYINYNIPDASFYLVLTILIIKILAIHLVLIFLPIFIHNYFSVPLYRGANIIFILLSVFSLITVLVSFIVYFIQNLPSKSELIQLPVVNIVNGIFIFILLYVLIICAIYYKKMEDVILKKINKSFIIFSLFIFFCIILQAIIVSDSSTLIYGILDGYIFPGFYLGWSLLSLFNNVKYFLHEPVEKIDDFSTDNFIKEYDLTSREAEIIKLILRGNSNNDISDELSISLATVKTHVHNIFDKTGVRSRTELMSIVIHER